MFFNCAVHVRATWASELSVLPGKGGNLAGPILPTSKGILLPDPWCQHLLCLSPEGLWKSGPWKIHSHSELVLRLEAHFRVSD